MNQVLRVDLLGASYAAVDGQEFSSLFVGQQAEPGQANAKGIEVMKLSCDTDVFRSLDANPGAYPMQVELHVRLKKAAGGKLGQHCVRAIAVPKTPAKGAQ